MPTFTKKVVASADDGYKYLGSGFWFPSSGVLSTGNQYIALARFTNVTIPQGAVINSAFIRLHFSSGANNAQTLTIKGVDEDNTATMSSDPTGRALTSASVGWSIASGMGLGTDATSPSIVSIIQEIVDRAGWASGNALAIRIDDNGSSFGHDWDPYDWSTVNAPYIEITYTVAGQVSITKSLQYTIFAPANLRTKLLRYSILDQELNAVPFQGLKVAKSGHNVINTKAPDNLKFSTDYNTLKYFIADKKTLAVVHGSGLYTKETSITHGLGFYPYVEVYAKDDLMTKFQPLGRYQAGSGADRQFFFNVTTTTLYFIAKGNSVSGVNYNVDFYYKIFRNNLGL